MKKISNYLGLFMLFMVLVLSCAFNKLMYPEIMLDTYGVIFDQYNFSGTIWLFWKVISIVTRGLALVTISVSLIAVVAEIQKFSKARFLYYAGIIVNFLNIIWLFSVMALEKNESILRFCMDLLSTVNHTGYSLNSNLYLFQSKLDYVSSRSFVLYMMVLLLLICTIWIKKSKQISECIQCNTIQIVFYTLEVGFLHALFDFCTESQLFYKMIGIESNQWDALSDSLIVKKGLGFYFYIPIVFLLLISLTLLFYRRLSKLKLLLVDGSLLLIHNTYVVFSVLNQISKYENNAKSQGILFYALTAKKIVVSECIGLCIFEFTALFILVHFLQKKCTFLQLSLFPICILAFGFVFLSIFQKIELWGIFIGIASLFFIAVYILIYRKRQSFKSLKAENIK